MEATEAPKKKKRRPPEENALAKPPSLKFDGTGMQMAGCEQKPWGRRKLLLHTSAVHVDELEILPGGFSSIHSHQHKFNLIFVLEGELSITVFDDPESLPKAIHWLQSSQSHVIAPLVWHQFCASTSVRAMEVCWASKSGVAVTDDDIIRRTLNGLTRSHLLKSCVSRKLWEV